MAALDYSNLGLAPGVKKPPGSPAQTDSDGTYSSSMTIEELTAPSGKRPRSVVLQGPSLPFRGAKWGGENSLTTEWYPGNGDEATQQSTGPRDAPSAWQGEWNRTRMGGAPTQATDDEGQQVVIVDPYILMTMLEEIWRAGTRLRVTWAVTSDSSSSRGKMVREGRAKSWDFAFDRIQDISWSVNYEWMGRGVRVQKVGNASQGALDAAAAAMNIALAKMAAVGAAQQLIASNPSIPNSATQLTLGQLENFADAPTTLITGVGRSFEKIQTQLQQVVDIAATVASQPVQVAEAAVSLAQNAVAGANQAADELGEIPLENLSDSTNVDDLMRSFRYVAQSSDAANAASDAGQQLALQMKQRSAAPALGGAISPQGTLAGDSDIIGPYVTRQGDTPKRVSMRYYGSPDHDIDIQQCNRRPWGEAAYPMGTIIIIPALRRQQRSF